jgi:uncharacterized membrane protein YciS (DUF1049 family)
MAISAPLAGVHQWHLNCSTQIKMLWLVSSVLVILWAVGLATAWTLGGFIHILLVLALAVFLIQVTMGQRPA